MTWPCPKVSCQTTAPKRSPSKKLVVFLGEAYRRLVSMRTLPAALVCKVRKAAWVTAAFVPKTIRVLPVSTQAFLALLREAACSPVLICNKVVLPCGDDVCASCSNGFCQR